MNLRLILPRYPGFLLNRENRLLWRLYQESYFHWFRLFNTTLINLKYSLSEIRASHELPVLDAIHEDIGDAYSFGFQPLFLPENVTTIGPIQNTRDCYLISYPRLEAKSVSIDGLKFMWHNTTYGAILAIAMIFFAILIISIINKRSDEEASKICWQMLWSTCTNQDKIRTSENMSRILWFSFVLILFLVQSVTIAFMDTDQVREYEFDRVENFEDVHRKGLIPVLEDFSGCTQIVSSQPQFIQNYLEENRYPRYNQISAVDMIFVPAFTKFSLKEMALLIDVHRWTQIKRRTCFFYPHILMENSVYRSRKPLLYHINSLVMNKRLDKKTQNDLNREASLLLEASLYRRKGWLAYQEGVNLAVDMTCMQGALKEEK